MGSPKNSKNPGLFFKVEGIRPKEIHTCSEIETPTRTKQSRKLAVEIRHRFQRAEDFFRRRIADIDHILQKKDELKINDTVFLEMLEKKYPFVSN